MPNNFTDFLEQSKEVGFVEQVLESLLYVQGLPQVHTGELVIFETNQLGMVISLNQASVEILLLSSDTIPVGTRATRTKLSVKIQLDNDIQGKTLFMSQLEKNYLVLDPKKHQEASYPIDFTDSQFNSRANIVHQFETGVTAVDLFVPLGKGQRELIIGDRKAGKTSLLLQILRTQMKLGAVCIYASIAQPQFEIQKMRNYFADEQLEGKVTLIAAHASDPPGLIFLTPYIAMTVAEFFRDQGKDVVVILDDLTTHAKYYREVMLLAKRFPGRSSYPGDIYHIHSRLLERAGSFKRGTITCLPVAECVGGDLTGYIPSNLMSMTDGHIFLDSDLFDQGRRPAVNPFLSVTRVGEQTQTPLLRSLTRQLRSFVASYEKVKQFKHFQTELGENIQVMFDRGNRVVAMVDQLSDIIVPLPVNMILCAALWADFWKNIPLEDMKREMGELRHNYKSDKKLQTEIDNIIEQAKTFEELIELTKKNDAIILDNMRKPKT